MKNFCNSYQKFVLGVEEVNKAALMYPEEFVFEVENHYKNQIENIAKRILSSKNNKRKIVMISGPSASGKTTTAAMIKAGLERLGTNSVSISLDNFYKSRQRLKKNSSKTTDYESLNALDVDEIKKCMSDLLQIGHCDIPKFDFTTGTAKNKIPIELKNNQALIIEGIHGLNTTFRNEFLHEDVTCVYISVKQGLNDYNGQVISNRSIRLVRRLLRDSKTRNSSSQKTLSMWPSVCEGQKAYIFPFKKISDITINSLHMYELCMMKNLVLPLLKDIQKEDVGFEKSKKLIESLERFYPIDLKFLPEDSMMREFIG